MGKQMIARKYGKIISLSSTWSTSTDLGKSVYGIAKAGVSYMTAALSTEWAPLGVRVNAIAPTTTLTENTSKVMRENEARAERLHDRIVIGRFAEPSDLVGAGLFLASPASDFVTGHTLFVNGGWHAGGKAEFSRNSLGRYFLVAPAFRRRFFVSLPAKPPARRRCHEKPAFLLELHSRYFNIGMVQETPVQSGLHVVHFHRQLRVRLPFA